PRTIRLPTLTLLVALPIYDDARLSHHALGFGLPVSVHGARVAGTAVALLLVTDAAAAARLGVPVLGRVVVDVALLLSVGAGVGRSEEHTSELQSRFDLVCR